MFSNLFSDLSRKYFVGVVKNVFNASPGNLWAMKTLWKNLNCIKMFGYWARNERAQGKKKFWKVWQKLQFICTEDHFEMLIMMMIIKKNPNFEWKKLERFAKIFRESLYLHFTFLEIFWAEGLFSENNSNFLKGIGFRAEKCLGLSKLHSLCANEYLEEIRVSLNNFSEFLWNYRETLSSRLSEMPSIRPKKVWATKFFSKFPNCI